MNDDRMEGWQDGRIAGCQAGKDGMTAGWQYGKDDMMAGWQDDRVAGLLTK